MELFVRRSDFCSHGLWSDRVFAGIIENPLSKKVLPLRFLVLLRQQDAFLLPRNFLLLFLRILDDVPVCDCKLQCSSSLPPSIERVEVESNELQSQRQKFWRSKHRIIIHAPWKAMARSVSSMIKSVCITRWRNLSPCWMAEFKVIPNDGYTFRNQAKASFLSRLEKKSE